MVSYHVAAEKKHHSIAETMIIPAMIDMVSTSINEKAAEK